MSVNGYVICDVFNHMHVTRVKAESARGALFAWCPGIDEKRAVVDCAGGLEVYDGPHIDVIVTLDATGGDR